MKVKVRNLIYDADKEPVMLILDESDKRNIQKMSPSNSKYCRYPDGMSLAAVEKFMGTEMPDQEITVGIYAAQLSLEVRDFKEYWSRKSRKDPEHFPPKLLPGEWDVQFRAWQEAPDAKA